MPDEIEKLERKIAEGLEAVRELKRLTAEEQRKDRPKLKLIRGGLIGAGIWSGVEWLRNGRRIATALVAAGVTVSGVTIAEYPGSPGADPPHAITQPPEPERTKRPTVKPTIVPTPRRTSPPRTQVPMRINPPAEPTKTTKESTQVPTTTPATRPPATKPTSTVSASVIPTVTPTVPVEIVTPTPCTINLLGIRVCLPLGQS